MPLGIGVDCVAQVLECGVSGTEFSVQVYAISFEGVSCGVRVFCQLVVGSWRFVRWFGGGTSC